VFKRTVERATVSVVCMNWSAGKPLADTREMTTHILVQKPERWVGQGSARQPSRGRAILTRPVFDEAYYGRPA